MWDVGQELMGAHCTEFGIPSLAEYLNEQTRKEIQQVETWGNLIVALATAPQPIGYIIWVLERHQGLGAPAAKMGPWYVEPPWRGTGLAGRLYAQSLRAIKYRGCRWVLTTLPIRG